MDRSPKPDRDSLLRAYATSEITWRELQDLGFDDYIEVLGGLGELGLRPPMARMIGPNVEARRRGLALLRDHLAGLGTS